MTYEKRRPHTIQSLFNSIAASYDQTNALLSFSLHKYWNRSLLKKIPPSASLADLCSGTGDIAFTYLNLSSSRCRAYLIDFSSQMLAEAKKKAQHSPALSRHWVSYLESDVHKLPLESVSVESATMAYGIRNVADPLVCMQEVFRVLQPGGTFGVLELTRPNHPLLRLGHRLYLHILLPLLGKWMTRNKEAYDYLCRSIEAFTPPEQLKSWMESSGFIEVSCTPLTGGIATIIVGKKPKNSS